MNFVQPQAAKPPGHFTKLMLWIAAVDEETLRLCPARDAHNAVAIGILMSLVLLYQAIVLTLISQEIFGQGNFRPEFLAGALFLAAFIMVLDTNVIMRPAWALAGIGDLRRGGVDISGGPWPKIKNGLMLSLRILLSLALAQLTAILLALVLFGPDLTANINNTYGQQNATVITEARGQVNGDIKQVTDAITAENARVTVLTKEVNALHGSAVDPTANDPQVAASQKEVDDLVAAKTVRDDDLAAAHKFASDELAGIRGAAGNTGVAGRGPVRRAAAEKVREALAADNAAAKALADARTRLASLRAQAATNSTGQSQLAQAQLPVLENDLNAASMRLTQLQNRLSSLSSNRDAAVRAAVDSAPDHVVQDNGLLGRLAALERIAQDRNVFALIVLIDAVSFSLEAAAVLAKVTTFVPTTYAALIARDAYLDAVRIADEVARKVNSGAAPMEGEVMFGPNGAADDDVDDGTGSGAEPHQGPTLPPASRGSPDSSGTEPPRRTRGRPRKWPLN